jgi:hypothetical protein
MTVGEAAAALHSPETVGAELPIWRLNLMRAGYAVMGVGLAVMKWPLVLGYDRATPLFEGVVAVLLTAMSLLALLGFAVSRPAAADPAVRVPLEAHLAVRRRRGPVAIRLAAVRHGEG